MCYTNIKPCEPLKQKYYYKITQENNGKHYGMFTFRPLPKNRWIKAVNVKDCKRIELPLFIESLVGGFFPHHAYLYNFRGFGVFSKKAFAERYLNFCSSNLIRNHAKIIKVLCSGDVRKAKTYPTNTTCYIFDKIKIID